MARRTPTVRTPPPADDGAALLKARPRHVTTTFRITPEQSRALRLAAVAMQSDRRGGKADASEILRLILDRWIRDREKPPHD